MEKINQAVVNFINDRPIIKKNNTFEIVVELLREEVQEIIDDGVDTDQKSAEIADVCIYAFSLFYLIGRDPETEIMDKLAYNHVQHSASFYQSGDLPVQRRLAKQWVIDREFKNQYYSKEEQHDREGVDNSRIIE